MTFMVDTNEFVLETFGLEKSFGDVHALRGVDLKVPAHSIFGFWGRMGWQDNLDESAVGLGPSYEWRWRDLWARHC